MDFEFSWPQACAFVIAVVITIVLLAELAAV